MKVGTINESIKVLTKPTAERDTDLCLNIGLITKQVVCQSVNVTPLLCQRCIFNGFRL